MDEIKLKSFAKVNIGLKVINKREDGFHNIHTVFQEVDFHDVLLLKKMHSGCTFSSNVKWLRNDESNLCVRAWRYILRNYDIDGVLIQLQKNIPPGSGLGGGSSNAATVLKGLSALYDLNLSKEDLCSIGSLLGADVPFFINGGCQIGNGIGDRLSSLDNFLKGTYLLVIPKIQIDTKWAYKKFNLFLESSAEVINFADFIEKDNVLFEFFENDFEKIIVPAYPEIGLIKNALLKEGAFFSSLSGSGSTVFGVFDDDAKAISAKSVLMSSYQTFIAHPIIK